MNTPNNKRRRESQAKIESALIELLQEKELHQIKVTDVCSLAKVNRTTFYANYEDIYALAEALMRRMEQEVLDMYPEQASARRAGDNFLPLFRLIKDNPLFYHTYFKLCADGQPRIIGYDETAAAMYYNGEHIDYHIAFFSNGLNAMIRKWLAGGCRESPEEMVRILKDEYSKNGIRTEGTR